MGPTMPNFMVPTSNISGTVVAQTMILTPPTRNDWHCQNLKNPTQVGHLKVPYLRYVKLAHPKN